MRAAAVLGRTGARTAGAADRVLAATPRDAALTSVIRAKLIPATHLDDSCPVPPDPEPTDAPRYTASADWTLCRGCPLARGLTRSFYWPLLLPPLCVTGFVAAVALHLHPMVGGVAGLLASVPLASVWTRHAARREAARVEVFADRVRFSSRRGEIVFPVATTRATVDVRETVGNWRAGTEQQVWTIFILESDKAGFSLGTLSPKAKRSGRVGVPMHACDRETLTAVAALWGVAIPRA